MDLDELQRVREGERTTDSLQHLPETFYSDVAEYVADLREERDRAAEAAEDPFAAPEVRRLTDEIQTAEGTVEALYERRVGKLVKLASFAAADMPADEDGLTAEERDLFEDIVSRIKGNRRTVLSVLAGESGEDVETHEREGKGMDVEANEAGEHEPGIDERTSNTGSASGETSAADAMGSGMTASETVRGPEVAESHPTEEKSPQNARSSGESERSFGDSVENAARDEDGKTTRKAADRTKRDDTARTTADDTDRVTVQIKKDVGEILGIDGRSYDLSADDIVTLPEANAKPLLEKDAVEPLE